MKKEFDLKLPVEHYIIYDISENAHELITIYSRLSINFPTHKDFEYWQTRFEYWVNYHHNIKNLGIDTLEKVSNEIDRTYAERHLMNETEDKLLSARKKNI
jgi:hypothetical protein